MRTLRWLTLSIVAASAPAQLPCHNLLGIPPIAQDLLAAYPFTGSSCIRIDQAGQTVFQQAFGSYTLAEVVPIASATKTLSAAVLMSLVDSGIVTLDDRVGQYLPEWNTGARALITLRMCFSHTSGLPASNPAVGDQNITLRQAAAQIASAPLLYAPGTAFAYGGVSMHVAGAVCEVASGQSWTQLFQQRIAGPLQMTATDYLAFGAPQNPRIAGGARSNLRDFAVLVEMLRAGGVWNGTTVLTANSVNVMLSDQTSTLPIVSTPHPEQAPYGIGIWIEKRDSQGRTLLASGVGAFGFAGFVDRARNSSGVFLVQNDNTNTLPYFRRVLDECAAALLPPGVSCVGTGSPACAGGTWLNASLPARGATPDFAIVAERAPVGLPGALLLGGPSGVGLPIGDLLAFLQPTFDVVAGLTADANGRASVPAPLTAPLVGATFGLQSVWLDTTGCTTLGLRASHALQVSVLP